MKTLDRETSRKSKYGWGKLFYYIAVPLLTLLVSNCADEEIVRQSNGIRVTGEVGTSSRTAYEVGEKATSVSWVAGDNIGLLSENHSSALQYRAATDGKTTDFIPVNEELTGKEGEKVYAYYPYVKGDLEYPYAELPYIFGQDYKDDAINPQYDFIYSTNLVQNNELSLTFHHLFAFLRITIQTNLLEEKDDQLILRSNEFIAYLDAYYDFTGNSIVGKKYEYLWINVPTDKLEERETITYYVAFLPSSENSTITLYQKDEKGQYNKGVIKRKAPKGGFKAGHIYDLSITENEFEKQQAVEKEALIAFYKATGGDNWTNNENWCSDKPVNEWYGISTSGGLVYNINLRNNNLTGKIPEDIGNIGSLQYLLLDRNNLTGEIPTSIYKLEQLRSLYLYDNLLTGAIPSGIGDLLSLEYLYLHNNRLTGSIPSEIGDLSSLKNLWLYSNQLSGSIPSGIGNLLSLENLYLHDNQLTGTIPSEMGNLLSLENLWLYGNQLTGEIPETLTRLPQWGNSWVYVIEQKGTGFNMDDVYIPAPAFTVIDMNGNTISSTEEYTKNKYTIIYSWETWCPYCQRFTPKLVQMYNGYKSQGVEVVGYNHGLNSNWGDRGSSIEDIKKRIDEFGITWKNFVVGKAPETNDIPVFSSLGRIPMVFVVKDNKIIFESITRSYNDLESFLLQELGPLTEVDLYTSTDYSKDGEVVTLQKASEGKGIDLVL